MGIFVWLVGSHDRASRKKAMVFEFNKNWPSSGIFTIFFKAKTVEDVF